MLSSSLMRPTTLVSYTQPDRFRADLSHLDNVCIESLSIDLTRPMLDSAARSVTRLGDQIEE